MKVFIIILHFGDIRITKACIQSVFANETYPFSLLVVNNTTEKLTARDFSKKNSIVHNNMRNFGFAAGVNKGIKIALKLGADAICLLNNDTIIQKPFLKTLLKELQERNVGIVGPAVVFSKKGKRLFDTGGKLNTLFLKTSHEEVSVIKDFRAKTVTYISGCCMVIKREVYKEIGLFDESFFLYYEDVDFCLRAKEKGFRTVVVPSLVIKHALSKSAGNASSFTIYHLLRSGILFGRKYAKGVVQKVANRLFILFQATLFLKANPQAALAIGKSLLK